MKPIAVGLVLISLSTAGCYGRGGRLLGAFAFTAIATAAIVSSRPPPPPQVVVYPPPPQNGYVWQPGYWTIVNDDWVWVEGRWIRNHPGYRWDPAHWVEDSGGRWRLIPGAWIADGPPPPGY